MSTARFAAAVVAGMRHDTIMTMKAVRLAVMSIFLAALVLAPDKNSVENVVALGM